MKDITGICSSSSIRIIVRTPKSISTITTEPNKVVAPIHNRTPVILPRNAEETWLNPDITGSEQLLSLLIPFPDSNMETYLVSPAINNPRNDMPDLIKRL
jgi:putative SOS response-associated peptidase YedK